MRGRFLLLALFVLVAVGCDDGGEGWGDANEIIFGVRQRIDGSSGMADVSAGYEFLSLAKQGGWAPYVLRDRDEDRVDRECYFERVDRRLGHPRVESGVATFTGSNLPSPGLQILANQPDAIKTGLPAWTPDDRLTFEVSGFAMPRLDPIAISTPRTDLAITTVTPAALFGNASSDLSASAALKATDEVSVTWTPTESNRASVMISLETEEANGPGGNVRCFTSASSGSAAIPADWVARLFSSVDSNAPIKGTLQIASHRQVTMGARGHWTVYVVATTIHREQTFRGAR